ncbi:MAG: NPCBM/NEW2 domain-containing protein [Planctomycetota bacterium]
MDVVRHAGITRAAIESLSSWQRPLLESEVERIADTYCMYPDIWRWKADRETHDNAMRFAHVEDDFERYCSVGLPSRPDEVVRFYEHYFNRIVEALREGDVGVAARYIGSFSHYVADMCSVGHGRLCVEGGQVFNDMYDTLLFPPPAESAYAFLSFHWLHESEELWEPGEFPAQEPQLLGRDIHEALFHITGAHTGIRDGIFSRYYPAVLALYRGDLSEVNRLRDSAYAPGIKLLADFIHTAICVAKGRFDGSSPAVETYCLSDFPPLDYQRDFVNHMYRGQALRNCSVERVDPLGWKKAPLALVRVLEGGIREVELEKGFGVGPNTWFAYYVGGAFQTLRLYAGNHARLGKESALRYIVEGDGGALFDSGEMRGIGPAREARLSIGNVRMLKFICLPCAERLGEGGASAKDHGIWGDVVVRR